MTFAHDQRVASRQEERETMLRFIPTTLAALAISAFPLASLAETAIDQRKTEAVVVAAVEDADPMPAPAPRSEPERGKAKRLVPHGSSQSEAGYRFTNPYAVPQQTLPLTFPALAVFSF
jgi:hypothetical protein